MLLEFLFVGIVLLFVLYFWVWSKCDPCNIPSKVFATTVTTETDFSKVPTTQKFCVIGAGFCGLGIGGALMRYL